MKIGIYGGSFNPIHKGHINLALQLTLELDLDKVVFVPANNPPHKDKESFLDGKIRYDLCKSVCEKYDKFEVSDIELKSTEINYTVNTLKKYVLQYPDSEIFLLLGSDMFKRISFWKGFDQIVKMATLCTMPRNYEEIEDILKTERKLNQFYAKTRVCTTKIMTISSTEIKDKIKKGEDVKCLLPKEIYEFIIRNNIYKQNN